MILHAMYLLLLHQTGYKLALSCRVSAYEHKWNTADAFIGLEMLNVAMAECSVAINHLSWEGGRGENKGKQGKEGECTLAMLLRSDLALTTANLYNVVDRSWTSVSVIVAA